MDDTEKREYVEIEEIFDGRPFDIEEEDDETKPILPFIVQLAAVFILSMLFVKYVFQFTYVSGSSMEPTLHDGQTLWTCKFIYNFKDVERFDVIVLDPAYEQSDLYIKRVIGLPGETIMIDGNGFIYIDGEILDDSYGKEVIKDAGIASQPITLEEDEYFVLGDNRNNSIDSRAEIVGPIVRDNIVGKAITYKK